MSLDTILSEYYSTIKVLTKKIKTEFQKEVKLFFKKYPEVETVSWTQYTPYFNDGESCEFSVNSYSASINEKWGEYNDDMPEEGSEMDKALTEFTDLLDGLPSNIMQDMYGDHVKVTINKDGTSETDNVDHD